MPERLVKLSRTAAEILLAIDGRKSTRAISKILMAKYHDRCLEAEVYDFLNEAVVNGWIVYEVNGA